MAALRLGGLDPCLLEKVITKLDKKSYFRLQQTCHWVNEFVRRSRNISIFLFGSYSLMLGKDGSPRLHQFKSMDAQMNIQWIEMEEHYGLRVRQLIAHDCKFEEVRDFLKKYHITCSDLSMLRANWTKAECVALFKMAKPQSLLFHSHNGSDRVDAPFQSKLLHRVLVNIDSDGAGPVTARLLSAFPDVGVTVGSGDSLAKDYQLVRTILNLLCTQPLPDLRKFHFSLRVEDEVPFCYHRLEDELEELDLMVTGAWTRNGVTYAMVDMPDGYSCKVVVPVDGNWVDVIYYGEEADTCSFYSCVGGGDSDDDEDFDFDDDIYDSVDQ